MKYRIEKIETEDEELFKLYIHAPQFHSALVKIFSELRNKFKYGESGGGSWEEAYTLVNEILNDMHLDIYDF